MLMLLLERHILWQRSDGRGGTIYYHYYDETTWVIAALALLWLIYLLIRRYRRLRALRRPPRGVNYRLLKRIAKIKNELSSSYLRAGFSNNIHAVGIGLGVGGEYCIHVFVNDATQELWAGAGATTLPASYRGVPLVLNQMRPASLLDVSYDQLAALGPYAKGIRNQQDVIVGGISGANVNLTGQSGTIGYFCKRKTKFLPCNEVYLLSNSHVFVDLQNPKADDSDLIMQPSPGERGGSRPIGRLTNFSPLRFEGDTDEPNLIDAAIGKLWESQPHKPLIPCVGAVKGYVPQRDVEVGEAVLKFGRSTGYTEGRIFSIDLDIRIRYDRTGRSAFFKNQLLIEPASPAYPNFVAKGDSGSLLVDEEHRAIGLVFAGMSQQHQSTHGWSKNNTPRIDGYGVANPISEVLDRLKIELLI